jgi:hypothetical protein
MIDPQQVKADSERIILEAGGRICEWIPFLDVRTPRTLDAIVGRALVLNAMLQIAFKAPTNIIKDWLDNNGVSAHLSANERTLLEKDNDELTAQETTDLYWYIEALWALLWVGNLIEDLAFDQPIQDYMASLCPALQHNEDGSKFANNMRIRSHDELFRMLDLYFRLHWWTRDGQLNGYETGDVRLDIIMERRKALEWVLDDSCDWDNVELST